MGLRLNLLAGVVSVFLLILFFSMCYLSSFEFLPSSKSQEFWRLFFFGLLSLVSSFDPRLASLDSSFLN